MKPVFVKPVKKLFGTVVLPGDKSISHRAAILAALSAGKTNIKNFLFSDDSLTTLNVLLSLGVKVVSKKKAKEVVIISDGCFKKPKSALCMSESGTSARIFLGVLAGQGFKVKVAGAVSLEKRPMGRVLEPLRLMGAIFKTRKIKDNEFLPVEVLPAKLHGIDWKQKIKSAQVKSAILLAGLFADGETIVRESVVTRDHTERMLKLFCADVKQHDGITCVRRKPLKTPGQIVIPGDISSAAFFIVAGLLVPGSKILIKNVSINPTRIGIVQVLKRMGASIKITRHKTLAGYPPTADKKNSIEPTADLEVKSCALHATVIEPDEIPSLIDELPILMVAAARAKGETVIKGAKELRIKETDRIRSMQFNLAKLGVDLRIEKSKDDELIKIRGVESFPGAHFRSFGDHRTAMSMFVAGLASQGISSLDDVDCISKSFPEFMLTLKHLYAK